MTAEAAGWVTGRSRWRQPLAVSPADPRDARDRDAFVGEGLGLVGRGLAVDAGALALATVDAPGLLREVAANVVAAPLHLRAQALQRRAE